MEAQSSGDGYVRCEVLFLDNTGTRRDLVMVCVGGGQGTVLYVQYEGGEGSHRPGLSEQYVRWIWGACGAA